MNPFERRPRTDYERRARRRTSRGRKHLLRSQKTATPRISASARRVLVSVAFAASLLVGVAASWRALETATGLWAEAPTTVDCIAVQGSQQLSAEEVASATGVARGCFFSDIDPGVVEDRLAAHPWIRSASATRLPPGQLVIEVEEREPRAVLQSGADETWQLVDADGTPFAPADPTRIEALPHLRSEGTFSPESPEPLLVDALALMERIRSLGIDGRFDASELRLPGSGSEGWVLLLGDASVTLGLEETDERLARLAHLLEAGIEEVREAKGIDLRFSNRAVLRSASISR